MKKTISLLLLVCGIVLVVGCSGSSTAEEPPAKPGNVPIQEPGPGMRPPGERGEAGKGEADR